MEIGIQVHKKALLVVVPVKYLHILIGIVLSQMTSTSMTTVVEFHNEAGKI